MTRIRQRPRLLAVASLFALAASAERTTLYGEGDTRPNVDAGDANCETCSTISVFAANDSDRECLQQDGDCELASSLRRMRRQIASDAVVLTDNEFKGLPLRPVARRAPDAAAAPGRRGAAVRAALERGWRQWNAATVAVPTLGMAYSRALAVFAAMVGIQVVTAHDAMPPALFELVARWEGWRAAHGLSLTTFCATLMYSATDVFSQTFEKQLEGAPGVELRVARTARSGVTAGFLSGFVAVFYYRWLDSLRFFPATIASLGGTGFVRTATLLPVLAKIGVDVGVYEPCYDTLYITIQALLRAEPRQILRELKAKVLKIWKLAPRYWILADLLNFSLVPLRLRPLVNALFTIPWSMYLSSMANRKPGPTPDEFDEAPPDGAAAEPARLVSAAPPA